MNAIYTAYDSSKTYKHNRNVVPLQHTQTHTLNLTHIRKMRVDVVVVRLPGGDRVRLFRIIHVCILCVLYTLHLFAYYRHECMHILHTSIGVASGEHVDHYHKAFTTITIGPRCAGCFVAFRCNICCALHPFSLNSFIHDAAAAVVVAVAIVDGAHNAKLIWGNRCRVVVVIDGRCFYVHKHEIALCPSMVQQINLANVHNRRTAAAMLPMIFCSILLRFRQPDRTTGIPTQCPIIMQMFDGVSPVCKSLRHILK